MAVMAMGVALDSLALSQIKKNLDAGYPPGDPKRNAILSYIVNSHQGEAFPYPQLVQAMMDQPQTVLTNAQAQQILGRDFLPGDLLAAPPPQVQYPSDPLPPVQLPGGGNVNPHNTANP